MRHTKIIATVGPASNTDAAIEALIAAGTDIVAVTRGGGTARRVSAVRPRTPIFATTDRNDMARRLSLYWGVVPLCTDIGENVVAAGTLVGQELIVRGLVAPGSGVVLIDISPDLTRSDANYLRIQRL